MSDALVDLKAALRNAMSFESELNRAWPLISAALSSERQAGRLQGREEAAQAVENFLPPMDADGYYTIPSRDTYARAARGVQESSPNLDDHAVDRTLATQTSVGVVSPSPEPEQQQ